MMHIAHLCQRFCILKCAWERSAIIGQREAAKLSNNSGCRNNGHLLVIKKKFSMV